MSNDYQIVTRHPTPAELLDKLVQFAPDFAEVWKTSLFINDDGTFTVHGVFAEFSHFVRDNFDKIVDADRHALFNFVEECVKIEAHSDSGISNAVCTCFLENIAGEGELSRLIRQYLGPESMKYFDEWN